MKILVVEDEPKAADYLRQGLAESGYTVEVANNGTDGLQAAANGDHDLVILDVMLPGIDGFAVLSALRTSRQVPVLMLTARDRVDDKVRGFDLGADDYLVKPFHHRELLARLRAVLRRAGLERPAPRRSALGDLALDGERREAVLGQRRVPLSRTEFRLLSYFMRRARRVVSATDLLRHVWERDKDDNPELVRVTVHRLRRKLAQLGPSVQTIRVLPGVGFIFEGAMDDAAAGERATATAGAPVRALFPLPSAVSDGA